MSLGPVLALLAALAALNASYQAAIWRRHAGHGRGTPAYARARDGRRYALWSLILAALLFVGAALIALPTAF